MSAELKNNLVVSNEIFFKELYGYIKEGKSVVFFVKGNSMLPFLKNGEKVIIDPIQSGDVRSGSILLARSKYGIVLHRVVRTKGDVLWLTGDGNLWQHEKIKRSDIIGIVKTALRNEKHVDVHNNWLHILAFLWYCLRPFRILLKKFRQLIK